ncbi:hypothetical protein XcuCFBP2542_02670 [Xanthomonas cucurbitae]|uniref:Uncharacterized protein n=1 Tax=Xanthomonas cucurbitae TaxID=56453 RepID=A0A2S7DWF9_9XANT|nr:hypothetical protein XcuCFBP2542_02670 [Xanthomonas cucurbitae]QHG86528.1 hypothetical protein EBN15_05510 [Xanthomonas cucurbitae]
MENRESGMGKSKSKSGSARRWLVLLFRFPTPDSRFPGPNGAGRAIMLRYPDDGCAGAHLNVL